MADYQFERYTTPIPEALARELMALWESVFGASFSWLADTLAGKETAANRDLVYTAKSEGRIVASCRLTISRGDRRLGALGEVATRAEHQGKHLGHRLCAQAAEEFDREGGQALFLGTVNPAAARMYARLGWRYLAGTKVMLRTRPDVTPEEFLVDYFRLPVPLPVRIVAGGPAFRVPVIPLIVTPHDWIVLDANTALLSTRYVTQTSCEGLYPRYETLRYRGAWFALARNDGAAVGVASASVADDGSVTVDAFAHPRYRDEWLAPLYQTASDWAQRRGNSPVYTSCARADALKQAVLERLGFSKTVKTVAIKGFDESVALYRIAGLAQEHS